MRFGALALSSALALFGCRPSKSPPAPVRGPLGCSADAVVVTTAPLVLEIDERCGGRLWTGFRISEEESSDHFSGIELERKGNVFAFDEPTGDAHVRYRIDLDAVARQADSFDVAMRSGKSLIATVSTWLLQPVPVTTGVPFELRVRVPPGYGFATGLAQRDGSYRIDAHELAVATYSVFGSFETRTAKLPGHGGTDAEIEIAVLDGAFSISKAALERWIVDSAAAVGRFWRGFPVPHVLISVIPVPGRSGVLFGKVLPESSPGIALLIGEKSDAKKLYEDWILVHELFHLGVPSFRDEGKWFDEGLATYFEPIIRARAGYKTETDVWTEFVREMPRGLRGVTRHGLERAQSFDDIYWGGAIVLLLADVEIRKRSSGARGLEDALRGVLDAGGTANQIWPLEKTLALADRSVGFDVLESIASERSHRGKSVDLGALFRELGVEDTPRGVVLKDEAPLAAIRKSIIRGSAQ